MSNLLARLENFFLNFDIYGRRVDVYINSKNMVKSKIGAFFSLAIITFCLYSFISNINSWNRNEYTQIVPASHTLNNDKMLKQNISYEYNFDSSNYYIYFVLSSQESENILNYDEIERYFQQYILYFDKNWGAQILKTEHCYLKKNNDFMLLDSDDLVDKNEQSKYRMCIKDGQKIPMGLFSDQSNSAVSIPQITYLIKRCVNSTSSNISCASNEKIDAMLDKISIQVSIPKSIYDFNDRANPRKRVYDYRYYQLDSSFCKFFSATLIPSYLMTDFGWFFDDYREDSVDFNLDYLQYETLNIGKDQTLFRYDFLIGHNKQVYFRKNPKLFAILANFGGIMNVLFILGKILCSTYNFLLLKHSLINISFSNLEKNSEKGKEK